MTDGGLKWLLGIVGSIMSALSLAAIFGVFNMNRTLTEMQAERPLMDQIRALELEQIRQGIQLNGQQNDVQNMEINDLDNRIRALENR